MSKSDFVKALQDYIYTFDDECIRLNIDYRKFKVDHIGYKCASSEEYEEIKKFFDFDSFSYQSIISNRRITIIGLSKPLVSQCGDVYYIELADQKPDGSQVSSCDHLEPIPHESTYEAMLEQFTYAGVQFVESIKPHHTTHDATLANGVKLKLSHEPLVEKIARDEIQLH